MDSVPYEFVASVMRVKLSSPWIEGIADCRLLGAKYGIIAEMVAQSFLYCDMTIPGVLSQTSLSEDIVFSSSPSFRHVIKKPTRGVPSPAPVRDVLFFVVDAKDVIVQTSENREKGLSVRRLRTLMDNCRFVPFRQLNLLNFGPDQFGSFLYAPGVTSFFNRVELQYHGNYWFKRMLLIFVEKKKIESLKLIMPENMDDSPTWLQDALTTIFLQPQFKHMELAGSFCDWIKDLVNRLISQWMERPETFSRMSKSIRYPYKARMLSKDALSQFEFRTIRRKNREDRRIIRLISRRFDRHHPTEVERRLIAKVFARKFEGWKYTGDYLFCQEATSMNLTFAFNEGKMARFLKGLKPSFLTMTMEQSLADAFAVLFLSCCVLGLAYYALLSIWSALSR
uniref:Uncharacterized protein n=1 Tax=Steinernema glaseri TaxID=37863 RepID=A0A1I7Z9R8_9BILA